MIETILYDALSTTNFDVFHGKASDNKKLPYILYNKTTQTIESHLTGNTPIINARFQVDLIADTYSECKTMETEARTAIEAITDAHQIIYSYSDLTDSSSSRIKIDLKLWNNK